MSGPNNTTSESAIAESRRHGFLRDWPRWAPFAAVGWSLLYGLLAVYWSVSGRGFPYAPGAASSPMGPLLGRLGTGVTWIIVIMAGLPAAALGVAMLLGVRNRLLRPVMIASGILLSGILLLLAPSLDLLVLFGYLPYAVRGLFSGSIISRQIFSAWAQWSTLHQLLCLAGGFLWLAATVSYTRRSGEACIYCGRRTSSDGWNSPASAARWGRIAVYVAMAAPVFYAVTRYAWALGIPLGMSEQALHSGQQSGTWISGLFLATFGLVGGLLMLGLVQRWGEVFPRWIPGLGGKRVPIALAVVPASIVSVLLVVGGAGIFASLPGMITTISAAGSKGIGMIGEITFVLGPTLLFPVWGAALAVATLGYYFRRRGPCDVCGRGAPVLSPPLSSPAR